MDHKALLVDTVEPSQELPDQLIGAERSVLSICLQLIQVLVQGVLIQVHGNIVVTIQKAECLVT